MAAQVDGGDGLPPYFEFWLGKKFGRPVSRVDVTRRVAKENTLSFVDAHLASGGAPVAVVWKQSPPVGELTAARIARGDDREAAFYGDLAPKLKIGGALPRCVFAGAREGEHSVLLEAVPGAAPVGDARAALAATPDVFAAYAALHGRTWGVVDHSWLRPRDRGAAAAAWCAVKAAGCGWDADVVACLDAALLGDAPPAPLARCVVHGSGGARHAICTGGRAALVDFARVAAGTPGEDLGAWAISALDPADRRAGERAFVAAYASALGDAAGADAGGYDAWGDYVHGGAGAVVGRLPALAAAGDASADALAANLGSFLRDNGLAGGSLAPRC